MTSPTADYFAVMGLLQWQIPELPDQAENSSVPEEALTTFESVYDVIAAKEARVVSFDVFDTLIVRDIYPAEGIQDKTVQFLHSLLAAQGFDLGCEEIRSLRRVEDDRLRSKSQMRGEDGEILAADSIKSWLSALGKKLNLAMAGTMAERLVKFEFDQEIRHAKAAPGAVEWLPRIAQKARIVAVSDTAWSASQVRAILEHCGLSSYIDSVFVSAEEGVNKRSGRLYERVLSNVHQTSGALLHFGDHAGSDCQVPRSLGIAAYQLLQPKVLRGQRMLETELLWARQFGYVPYTTVDPCPRDSIADSKAYRLGREVFALPFFLFVRHLLEIDNRCRFQRLFFLSRDGYLPWLVFRRISEDIELFRDNQAGRRAAYVHLSRVSTTVPDLESGMAELVALHDRWMKGRSPADIFDLLGVEGGKYRAYLEDKASSATNGKGMSVIELLRSDPEFRHAVAGDLAAKRDLLETYLESIGFFCGPDTPVMLVDIGWKGTVVRNIEKLFSHRPDYPRVHLLMWGVARDYSDIEFDLLPGYFSDTSRTAPLEALVLRCHEAFEMVSAEPVGGCSGYVREGEVVVPRFMPSTTDENLQNRSDIQQGVLDAIPAWLSWYNKYLIADELRVTALARMLQPILRQDNPYHALLMDLYLDLDIGSSRRVRLGSLLAGQSIDLSVGEIPTDLRLPTGSHSGRSPAFAYERLLAVITEVTLPDKPLVLWGVGVIGRLMLPHLRSRVEFILDSNPSLQGTEFDGIPVIPPESVRKRDLTGHIVVFTPLNRRPQIDLSCTGAEIVLVDDRLR